MSRREQIPVGAVVTWNSQAGGFWKEKRGMVLGFVPAGADARDILARLGVTDRLMAQAVSRVDRYLVRVQTGRRAVRVYAPRADMLEFWGEVDDWIDSFAGGSKAGS